jgi:putative FmdB family regulatory protein
MPIYAYRCDACGHAKDVLQKVSDPLLTKCPVCGAEAFRKQLTAAGFQLKGSGWYVTDFRGDKSGKAAAPAKDDAAAGDGVKSDAKAAESAPSKPADAGAAPSVSTVDKAATPSDKAAKPAPSTGAGGGTAPAK